MIGLLFSALTLAVGADTSNQYTELFSRADSAFEAEFKDSIDMAKMTREEKKALVDKAAKWFTDYLFDIGYPDDWCRDNLNNGEAQFYKAMMEE